MKPSSNEFSKAVRDLVRERSGEVCERCSCQRATDFHHRRLKGRRGYLAGNENASNCLHVCRGCHRKIHAHPTPAREAGFIVESHEDPRAVPVRLFGGWRGFFTDEGGVTAKLQEVAS